MKKTLLALGAFAFLGAAVPAQAQESRPLNLSLRAGFFLPASDDARDEAESWFLFGGEFGLQDLPTSPTNPTYRARLTLSADFISGGDFRTIPVLVNYVGSRNEWFYSVGAGFSFADFDGDEDQLFTFGLGIGYNFQQGQTPAFIEARYFGTSESNANGLALSIGVRL